MSADVLALSFLGRDLNATEDYLGRRVVVGKRGGLQPVAYGNRQMSGTKKSSGELFTRRHKDEFLPQSAYGAEIQTHVNAVRALANESAVRVAASLLAPPAPTQE